MRFFCSTPATSPTRPADRWAAEPPLQISPRDWGSAHPPTKRTKEKVGVGGGKEKGVFFVFLPPVEGGRGIIEEERIEKERGEEEEKPLTSKGRGGERRKASWRQSAQWPRHRPRAPPAWPSPRAAGVRRAARPDRGGHDPPRRRRLERGEGGDVQAHDVLLGAQTVPTPRPSSSAATTPSRTRESLLVGALPSATCSCSGPGGKKGIRVGSYEATRRTLAAAHHRRDAAPRVRGLVPAAPRRDRGAPPPRPLALLIANSVSFP